MTRPTGHLMAPSADPSGAADIRTGQSTDAIAPALIDNLRCLQGKLPQHATRNDWYMAIAYTVRDRMIDRYIRSLDLMTDVSSGHKAVAYLSAEFLVGPHLGNGLVSLGIWDAVEQALAQFDQDLPVLLEQEEEPGLGNGGLGRLAACFMDSLATLNVPAIGYGLRYEFGIFDQVIRDGWQVEITDKWLRFGNPWEIVRSEIAVDVKLGGRTEPYRDDQGHYRVRWIPDRVVRGIAYDTPVPGYRGPTTNLLRLWKAEAADPSTSRPSISAITTAPSIRRWSRKPSPRCCTRMTNRSRGRNCGWRSSTSSSPVRCRT